MADRDDIIITKTDKGGALVIIVVEDHVKEAEHQLNNKDVYKKLQHDPTQTHTRLVKDTITCFKNDKLITENIAKGLQVEQPETPKFYTRPKIQTTGNPRRPVVRSKTVILTLFQSMLIFISSQLSKIYLHMQETLQISFKN